jgi:hypothetical protein
MSLKGFWYALELVNTCSHRLSQEGDDLLSACRSFLVSDIVACEAPVPGGPQCRIDFAQFLVDDIQSFGWCKGVLRPRQREVRARCDQHIDVGRREVLEQTRNVIVDAVVLQSSLAK